MVGPGWIGREVVEQRLYEAAVQNGSVQDDGSDAALATIKSGIEAGLDQPHSDLAAHEPDAEERDADEDIDPDLVEMNAKYAVVRIGGKTRVVTLEDSPAYPGSMVPVFSTIPDFCAFHAKRKKEVVLPSGAVKRVGLGKWWIDHEERRQYDAIVYAPNGSDDAKLNLFTGFGCAAEPGNCSLYLAHLHDNICAGNPEHSKYLLGWMAYAVQHAGRQGEVAVVLRGKEGTGKGVFAKEFGRLFGSHFKHIVNAKHLVGHFNAHLQHCSVLFADEAFFAGDRSHESVLKGLITEETILVEPKGVDPYSVRNCVHLIMSSNSDWVVPAGADARRYFVLDVADTRLQDYKYRRYRAPDGRRRPCRVAALPAQPRHLRLRRALGAEDSRAGGPEDSQSARYRSAGGVSGLQWRAAVHGRDVVQRCHHDRRGKGRGLLYRRPPYGAGAQARELDRHCQGPNRAVGLLELALRLPARHQIPSVG
jgi:hypothetical protein